VKNCRETKLSKKLGCESSLEDKDFNSREDEFKISQKMRPGKKHDDRKHSVGKEPATPDKFHVEQKGR